MKADLLPDDKWINIPFATSPQAGARQERAPGTCAWVDRPIRANEPGQLSFKFEKRPWKYDHK